MAEDGAWQKTVHGRQGSRRLYASARAATAQLRAGLRPVLLSAQEGGLALEQEYPYLSNNDFCHSANYSRPGAFEGFLEIGSRDEDVSVTHSACSRPYCWSRCCTAGLYCSDGPALC